MYVILERIVEIVYTEFQYDIFLQLFKTKLWYILLIEHI